jgi:hypothetical protein
MLDTEGTQKTERCRLLFRNLLFLESNKNNFTSCFSKITGFIMLKANLQEFNFVLLIFNLLL